MPSRTQPRSRDLAQEAVQQIKDLKGKYHRTFTSSEGWEVLKDLQSRFYDMDLLASEPHATFANVGSHRVIQHIQQMMEGPHDVDA